MDWGDAPAWAAVAVAVAALGISIKAHGVGKRSASAAEQSAADGRRSADSAASAEAVAKIDQARWHAELTPVFEVTIDSVEGDRARLNVQLVGPLPLSHLDEVKIIIGSSDDQVRLPSFDGRRPTQGDVDSQVWGPWRFTHGADGADIGGTTVDAVPLRVGRGRPFAIERTRPGFWQEGPDGDQRWRSMWAEKPVKLSILCRRDDSEPWTVPISVDQPPPPDVLLH